MGALTEDDVDTFRRIREHRDQIAHDMPNLLGSQNGAVEPDLLLACFELIRKLSVWWTYAGVRALLHKRNVPHSALPLATAIRP